MYSEGHATLQASLCKYVYLCHPGALLCNHCSAAPHLDQMQIDKEEQLCPDKRIRKCGELCHKVIISDSSNKNLLSPQLTHNTKREQFDDVFLELTVNKSYSFFKTSIQSHFESCFMGNKLLT